METEKPNEFFEDLQKDKPPKKMTPAELENGVKAYQKFVCNEQTSFFHELAPRFKALPISSESYFELTCISDLERTIRHWSNNATLSHNLHTALRNLKNGDTAANVMKQVVEEMDPNKKPKEGGIYKNWKQEGIKEVVEKPLQPRDFQLMPLDEFDKQAREGWRKK